MSHAFGEPKHKYRFPKRAGWSSRDALASGSAAVTQHLEDADDGFDRIPP
jgi:hypothetical protein